MSDSGSDDEFFEQITPKQKGVKSPPGSTEGGGPDNIKKRRPAPALHWLFTYNNPPPGAYNAVKKVLQKGVKRYAMQTEVGKKTGTPHFHVYVNFWPGFKKRGVAWWKSTFPAHAGKPDVRGIRKNTQDVVARYCLKTDTWTGKERDSKKILVPRVPTWKGLEELYEWQKKMVKIIVACLNSRKLFWIYDEVGNVGKSELLRHFKYEWECLLLGGAKKDMIYRMSTWSDLNPGCSPEFILVDVCRAADESAGVAISWYGLEELGNGGGFSGKYESCEWEIPEPARATIIVANEEPPWLRLSRDRWEVYHVKEKLGIATSLNKLVVSRVEPPPSLYWTDPVFRAHYKKPVATGFGSRTD